MHTPSLLPSLCLSLVLGAAVYAPRAQAQVNVVQTVAKDVYFHEGEIKTKGHCNNGWIIFEDYVLVVDANFPSGAKEILPKIRAITNKPIRFVFDTHHHGDHAYANQVWHEEGAVPVAHSGVITEMKKYEGKTFGTGTTGRWEEGAKARKDMAESRLKAPTVLFNRDLVFDDGTRRVELLHFGTAHTHGDGFAWLPKEKILFTGDACVNGAFNYMGDGNSGEWIKTLQAVKALGAQTICPGHGPVGGPEVLEDQIQYFVALREEVSKLRAAGKTPEQAKNAIGDTLDRLKQNPRIQRYVGKSFASQMEKVWLELGGTAFPE